MVHRPPLYDSFLHLLDNDPEKASQGLNYYRERFGSIGLFENEVYQGIHDCLARLKDVGLTLFICTSKPHFYATQIAEHFQFDQFFKHIHGSELTGERVDKGELITYIIEQENIDPACTIMIGDREHDIIGARKNGLRTLGVTYGYGSKEELNEAGADQLVENPGEIAALVLR